MLDSKKKVDECLRNDITKNSEAFKSQNIGKQTQDDLINDLSKSESQTQDEILKEISILKTQKEELNKKIKDRDKFIKIIGHDLRGSMISMHGLAMALLDEIQDKEQKKLTQMLVNSSYNTFKLLEDLLSWAKLGEIQAKPLKVNLRERIINAYSLYQVITKQKNIKLDYQSNVNLDVYADINMLDRIIQNLVGNSLKFTKSGGNINISADTEGEFVKICVQDDGIGMSEEHISKIFKWEGKGLKKDGTDGEKGIGLGLQFCKELVTQNGGQIWCESEVGKGSKFYFTLPKAK